MKDWISCQLGAREHYAIPRALVQMGCLNTLCTDIWASAATRGLCRTMGRRGRSLAGRHHPDIPADLVTHWTARALGRQVRRFASQGNLFERFIEDGEWFGGLVLDWLARQPAPPQVLFSYDTTALEPFTWAKQHGSRLILGQMDPGPRHYEIVAEERERWPDWEPESDPVPEAYHARRAAEWELADRIIVNSAWSRDALMCQGVPASKLVVVPLVFSPPNNDAGTKDRQPRTKNLEQTTRPLRVLFLGKANLGKGIARLIDAARILGPDIARFEVVGTIQISSKSVASAPSNMRFTGPVSRSEVAECYRRADVFVLPTLSDGFGITQLEAMAQGLPVIATPNCGDVVTDGVDGRIVPARDGQALATAIQSLADDRECLLKMSGQALLKSHQFTIMRLSRDLQLLAAT